MRRIPKVQVFRAAAGLSRRTAGTVPESGADGDQLITPWDVNCRGPKGIDYDRVRSQFQSQEVTAAELTKLEAAYRAAGSDVAPHHFFRRGIAFSHRDLDVVLDDVIAGRRAYLYTGRGPSAASMHVGHIIPFLLTQHLQRALKLPLVIQLTDDEKFLFRDTPLTGAKADAIVMNNIKDIIAFGFDPARTFIFRNTAYMGRMYPTVVELQRLMTLNAVKNTFGFADTDCVGKVAFPAIQAAPCFASAFPAVLPLKSPNIKCLIPCAIDQDPFFVLTRSIAPRIKRPKPALLHTKFLPALKGPTHKMSSSAVQNGVLSLSDTPAEIRTKVRSAFSGGSGTLEDLRRDGPNLDVDVAFQMCRVFMADDAALGELAEGYKCGRLSTADVKDVAARVLIDDVIGPWKQRRDSLTDADVARFLEERDILFAPSNKGHNTAPRHE